MPIHIQLGSLIDETAAEVVHLIFFMRAGRIGCSKIAREHNEKGIMPRRHTRQEWIEIGEARIVNGQKERQIRLCHKFARDIG